MNNKTTIYQFILDQSGSMNDVRERTVAMFNKQLDTIKELQREYPGQEFRIGLTVFNDQVSQVLFNNAVTELHALRYEMYRPSGMTALYDAIGETVIRIQDGFQAALNNDNMSVVVIILTDGGENSSRRFSGEQIATMIKELEATGKWTFNILGADFDIGAVSSKLNFQKSNSSNYSKKDYFAMEEDLKESLHAYAKGKDKGVINKEFLFRKDRK